MDAHDNDDVSIGKSQKPDSNDLDSIADAMIACEVPLKSGLSGPDRPQWEDAIYQETRSLVANDTFTLVERPPGAHVIKCRTVLRNKFKSDGTLERRKARVVAKGFTQRPGIDFFETFAPVARLSSLRLLAALAARYKLDISQLDIETAYLNGKIDTDVYMEPPELIHEMLDRMAASETDPTLRNKARSMLSALKCGKPVVCKLLKALYGLRQAGRQRHTEIDLTLKKAGVNPINSDPCIYKSDR